MSDESTQDRYKMFGEIALEKGFVTAVELYEALTAQAKDQVDGRDRLLGQILIEMGFMTAEQVTEVLDILFPPEPAESLSGSSPVSEPQPEPQPEH